MKNLKHIFLLILSLYAMCPEVNAGRLVQSFNDGWHYAACDDKSLQQAQCPDREWQQVHLPHTWNTDAYSTGKYRRASSWYKKEFLIDSAQMHNKQLYLKFDAVNSLADVYLNGELLTTHKGGYSAFSTDITDKVRTDVPNILMVHVNNQNDRIPPLSGDFTIFGGIYRNVWLISADKQHVKLTDYASSGVYVDLPSVNEDEAEISVRGTLENHDALRAALKLGIRVLDADGKTVASTMRKVRIDADGAYDFKERLLLDNPRLWSPDTPYLYSVEVTLKDVRGEELKDLVRVPLGVRWFSADTKEGFKLNGKPIKLMGACRHQDQKPMGIALSDEMHRRDMQLLKDMGANFVRLAHYPQDDAVLHACDELGIMVWEEIPIVDLIALGDEFRTNATNALREMIRQHYNHPSVVMWGYMNEVVIQLQYRVKKNQLNAFYENTLSLARHLEETLKHEDPYRLSTMAYHGSQLYNKIGLSNITDISGWNLYQGWYGDDFNSFDRYVDEEHRKYPHRPLFISEFGAGSDSRLQSLKPQIFDFSMQWQQQYLEHYLPAIMKRPFIVGATEWNFVDFSSASRQEATPHINNKGLLYNDRRPKDVFYYFQAFLRKDVPVLHIAVDDWKQRTVVSDGEAVEHPVKVYSNMDEVELTVNGQKLSGKKMENCHAVWQVPLVGGRNTLVASGMHKGKKVEQVSDIYVKMQPRHITKSGAGQLELAVNVGSNCFFTDAKSDLCWLPDQAYTPGSWGYIGGEIFRRSPGRIGTTAEVKDSRNVPLLQTKRTDIEAYRFDLPDGESEVELLFADLNARSERVTYDLGAAALDNADFPGSIFNVAVNGQQWLKNFSPAVEVGGNRCLSKKIRVAVTDGHLTVAFEALKGSTFLNAIKINKGF